MLYILQTLIQTFPTRLLFHATKTNAARTIAIIPTARPYPRDSRVPTALDLETVPVLEAVWEPDVAVAVATIVPPAVTSEVVEGAAVEPTISADNLWRILATPVQLEHP